MAIPLIAAALAALVEAAEVTLVVCAAVLTAIGLNEMIAADEEADRLEEGNPASSTDACSTCPPNDRNAQEGRTSPPPAETADGRKLQEQRDKKAELEQSCPQVTTQVNIVDHESRPGGYDQAVKDFDDLELDNVRDIKPHDYGRGIPATGKAGVMKDGTKVTVRPDSRDGTPTLEFQPSDEDVQAAKRAGQRPPLGSKIRYDQEKSTW